MASIKIKGDTSGSTTITAPATGSDETIELSTALASKLPYSYGTATPTTSDDGFLWYDSNSSPAEVKFWDGAAFQTLTSGKILQIVRATDATARSTTSTSFVDASISVTITPTKSTSALILIWNFHGDSEGNNRNLQSTITDSSDNSVSGAETNGLFGASSRIVAGQSLIGYVTPATTSAVTYKGRFREPNGGFVEIRNDLMTGQIYAIEVSA